MTAWGARVRRWLADGRLLDAAIAVALTAISQAQLPAGESWWVRVSMLVVLVLAVRRRWPLACALSLGVVLALQGLSVNPPANFGLYLAVMLASFTVAAECPLGRAVLGAVALAAGVVLHDLNSPDYGSAAGMASDLAIPVILWFVGRGVRFQRGRADRAGLLLAQLEADQEDLARLAVVAERRHLARELHDVVTHSVTVAVIQSQGAQRALTGDQPVVAKALADIEAAARTALIEMRRLLGVLRDEEDGAPVPAPSLADLPELVARVGAAGLTVELTQSGAPGGLEPSVELTAYRVVQEALTNALRHAAPGRVEVRLEWTGQELVLDVLGDAAEAGSVGTGSGGRGLVGLQERVAAHGGTLRSGARSEGGYLVAARLPVRPA